MKSVFSGDKIPYFPTRNVIFLRFSATYLSKIGIYEFLNIKIKILNSLLDLMLKKLRILKGVFLKERADFSLQNFVFSYNGAKYPQYICQPQSLQPTW